MIRTSASQLQAEDRATFALGMALCALFLELAINADEGQYVPILRFWLTITLIVCFAAPVLRFRQNVQDFLVQRFPRVLGSEFLYKLCGLLKFFSECYEKENRLCQASGKCCTCVPTPFLYRPAGDGLPRFCSCNAGDRQSWMDCDSEW
jgi:hypothetical protein